MFLILLLLEAASEAASKMEPFIVGGNEVSINRWPFIAFIEATQGGQASSACGGSLLSSQTVLTAAHCVDDLTSKKTEMDLYEFTIYMGHSTIKRATMKRRVIDYTSHKTYDPMDDEVRGDIAIMFLVSPVKFHNNILKVLLVQRNFDVKKDRDLEVAGWGKTDPYGTAGLSQKLRAAQMTAISPRACQKEIVYISSKVICAAVSRQYAYSGDSGGPLIRTANQQQIGLVSYRHEDTGVTVFTSVPAYYYWIRDTQMKMFRKYCPSG